MDWVTYEQLNFISHSLDTGKFKIKAPSDSVSSEYLFTATSQGRRCNISFTGLEGFTPWPNRHPRASPFNTITLGIRFQHMNLRLGREHNIQTTAVTLEIF